MLSDLLTAVGRVWADITGGVHAPLGFRVIVQPVVASFFAIRAGLRDAREGRPPYVWALLNDPGRRRDLVREGCAHVGKIFIAAFVIDVIYQVIVLRWVYPGEALMVAAILAVLPYLAFRGLANRILSRGRG